MALIDLLTDRTFPYLIALSYEAYANLICYGDTLLTSLLTSYSVETYDKLDSISVSRPYGTYALHSRGLLDQVGNLRFSCHVDGHRLRHRRSNVSLFTKEQRSRILVKMFPLCAPTCQLTLLPSLNSRISRLMQYTLGSGLFTT